MEAIWKKEHSLAELVANDQFKTYDELKTRLSSVLGTKPVRNDAQTVEQEEELVAQVKSSRPTATDSKLAEDGWNKESEDDDALSYFSKLAEE